MRWYGSTRRSKKEEQWTDAWFLERAPVVLEMIKRNREQFLALVCRVNQSVAQSQCNWRRVEQVIRRSPCEGSHKIKLLNVPLKAKELVP
jgi:hypothetical protein